MSDATTVAADSTHADSRRHQIEAKQQQPPRTPSTDQTIPPASSPLPSSASFPPLSSSASPSSHLHHQQQHQQQLSALERDAQVLAQQFQSMLASIQSSHSDLSALTVTYMRSLKNSSLSTSSSVGILLDTHTSLIRKMLIAAQQSAGMDALERSVETTKNTLAQMEKGVEALLADEALQRTRAELTAGLQAKQATIVESEDEEEEQESSSQQARREMHDGENMEQERGNATFAGVSPIATHDTERDPSAVHSSLQQTSEPPSSNNTSLTFSAFSTPIILAGGGTASASGGVGAHSGFNSPLPPPSMHEPQIVHSSDVRHARNTTAKPNPIDDIEPL